MLEGHITADANRPAAIRVALINSIVERYDAISASVRDMADIIKEAGHDLTIFCYKSEYADLRAVEVGGINDLLLHDDFIAADLIIWHFGIFYELFNVSLIGNGKAPQVVCFHNVTPIEFAPAFAASTIERSLEQIHLLSKADEIWAVSELNARTALDYVDRAEIVKVIPLQVDWPVRTSLESKKTGTLNILYVGRFTAAKGVKDLLKAIESLPRDSLPAFRVRLAGNVAFSDPACVAEIETFIDQHELEGVVELLGTVTDDELASLYADAHILCIASYHEGVCKPILEGLRSGCIPVVYDAYNLPFVVDGLGKVVETGDVNALAEALGNLIGDLDAGLLRPDEPRVRIERGLFSVRDFDAAAKSYTQGFTRPFIADKIAERIASLCLASHDEPTA